VACIKVEFQHLRQFSEGKYRKFPLQYSVTQLSALSLEKDGLAMGCIFNITDVMQ